MKAIRLYFSKAEKAVMTEFSAMVTFVVSMLAEFANFCAKCVQSPRFATAFLLFMMVTTVLAGDTAGAGGGTGDTAAGNAAGVGALEQVTSNISGYLTYVQKLCYAIAGIVAVVGAISVYIAMNNEEQDVKKKIMMTVGACIFLIAAAQALPSFFGNGKVSE